MAGTGPLICAHARNSDLAVLSPFEYSDQYWAYLALVIVYFIWYYISLLLDSSSRSHHDLNDCDSPRQLSIHVERSYSTRSWSNGM